MNARILRTLTSLVTILLTMAGSAMAQEQYPANTVTMVVPFPPGGGTDVVGRIVATKLSEILPRRVVVENRPGAGGSIGSQAVAASKPDGYTILVGTAATHGINVSLYRNLPYHPLKDFEIVAFIVRQPFAYLAAPTMPGTLEETISLLKAQPQKYAYASAGNGTTSHLYGEMLKTHVGVDVLHVPYKGGAPALLDIMSGRVIFLFESLGFARSQIEAGKVRAVAVAGQRRSPLFPQVPTFAEAGIPGFEASTWNVIVAPAKTPKEVVHRLNAVINKAMSDPGVQAQLAKLGFEAVSDSTPESATAIVKAEIDKFAAVVSRLGMKID